MFFVEDLGEHALLATTGTESEIFFVNRRQVLPAVPHLLHTVQVLTFSILWGMFLLQSFCCRYMQLMICCICIINTYDNGQDMLNPLVVCTVNITAHP